MNIADAYDFIIKLTANNNREWFNAHKAEYEQAKTAHEEFISLLITKIALFDEDIKGVNVKECTFRIYRDTRFSPDKTPYKNHLGAYIAAQGGRNSERAGYYVHLSPDENFVSGGVYCPQPAILKALRNAIYNNVEEYLALVNRKDYKQYFTEFFSDSLKTLPRGYPKDFEHADLLKCRHYSPAAPLPNDMWRMPDCMDEIVKRLNVLHPYNKFMNFTIDECLLHIAERN
ncbi:MAG: DUF2461 domain-containing protein [Bacteroidales bacterium]|jgi:uncharacterized protein (TIGR02453 family)|nr:DUF2461 domain-containing protein [Bacteroidales bacterium]